MTADDHIHDCTGVGARCHCGYVFRVPPICFSVEITNRDEVIVDDGFNCDSLGAVISRLKRLIATLEGL